MRQYRNKGSVVYWTEVMVLFLLFSLSFPLRAYPEAYPPQVDFIETISENGHDRGTSYYMSNKIITADGKIFVGWLDWGKVMIRMSASSRLS